MKILKWGIGSLHVIEGELRISRFKTKKRIYKFHAVTINHNGIGKCLEQISVPTTQRVM